MDFSERIGERFKLMNRDEIRAWQSERLAITVKQAAKSPWYKAKFAEMGLDPEDIKSCDDIKKLPLTTKEDLRLSYPDKMLAVDKSEIVRLHTSSGTTGKPTAIFHTAQDIQNWAELMARSINLSGATDKDVLQNMSGYGMFTGGLGIHFGGERLGMMMIPAGPGNTPRHLMLIRDFGVTAIHATPSYAMHVADEMISNGEDPKALGLKYAFLGAEPYTEAMRQRLQELYGFKVYNSYGLSEMNGPGVAMECTYQNGMHIWEDSYIVEVINPETLEDVPEGEIGELVLTPIRRMGMPIIRYRTRDLTRIIPGKCECGLEHRRLARFVGRSDDMLIVRGVNIFPSRIEQVLMAEEWLGGNYVLHLTREDGKMDVMTIRVELAKDAMSGSVDVLKNRKAELGRKIKDAAGFTAIIELVEPGSLPVSMGKAKRVIDERDIF